MNIYKYLREIAAINFLFVFFLEQKEYYYLTLFALILIPWIIGMTIIPILGLFIDLSFLNDYAIYIPIYVGILTLLMLWKIIYKNFKEWFIVVLLITIMLVSILLFANTQSSNMLKAKISNYFSNILK